MINYDVPRCVFQVHWAVRGRAGERSRPSDFGLRLPQGLEPAKKCHRWHHKVRHLAHLLCFLTCNLCEPPPLMVCVDAQVLLGREEGGQLPPGGRDGPQAALQPAHAVQGPQVRSRQPLQERAEVTVRGGRPETRTSNFPGLKKIQRLKHWFLWHSDWCRAFAWASWLSWTGAPTLWSRNWCVSTSCWGTASVSNRSDYKWLKMWTRGTN